MANFPGTSGNDALSGGVDDDILNSDWLGGDDTMLGGAGDDIYRVNSIGDVVAENPNEGTDTVESRLFSYTLLDNFENLTLDPAGIFGIPFAVNGTGNALDNVITGNSRANTLSGLDGNDSLIGSSGNDTLDGGTGKDTLDGGTGADSMTGGNGNDDYIVDNVGDVVVEAAGAGTGVDLVKSSITFTLVPNPNVENLTLTGTAAINGTGNSQGNRIVGNDANNLLTGMGGADTLTGGGGADTLDGGASNDSLTGGLGNDRYIVDSALDLVTELANEGTDTVVASVTYTLTDPDVENLDQFAAVGNVNGTGNASNNTLTGNNSNNTLLGLAGADSFFASGGDDTIQGGDGADTLRGGTGDDTLYAFDLAISDDGDVDKFQFDTAVTGVDVDTIVRASFVAGSEVGDDQLQLENSIFTALRATGGVATVGTLDASMYQAGAGLTGSFAGAAVGIYHNTTTGQLFYNDSTAAGSVQFAVLNTATANGGAALDINEWVLV